MTDTVYCWAGSTKLFQKITLQPIQSNISRQCPQLPAT